MFRKNRQNLPVIAFGMAFVLWGLNTPFVKIGLEEFPVLSLLAIKYIFGAIVFTFLARKHWKLLKAGASQRVVVATLCGYVLASVLFYYGIKLTGGLTASLIYLLSPLLLYLLSIEVLKERYNARLFIGVIAGLLGALLIIGLPLLDVKEGSQAALGSLLIFLAVVTDVAGTILIKPQLKALPVTQMTAVRFIIAALVFAPFLLVESAQLSTVNLTTPVIIAVGYNLIFATLGSFFLYHWGLRRISGEQASPFFYIDPMVGAVGSIIILGDQLTTSIIAGVILIIVSLYLSETHQRLPLDHFRHHR